MNENTRRKIVDQLDRGARSPIAAANAMTTIRELVNAPPAPPRGATPKDRPTMDPRMPPAYEVTIPAPDRYLVVPVEPTIAASTQGAPIPVTMTGLDGILVDWKVVAIDPTGTVADAAQYGAVRVSFNGQQNVIYNGEAESFANLATLFSTTGIRAPFWYPIDGRDVMTVTYRNDNSATALRFYATFGRITAAQARRHGLL